MTQTRLLRGTPAFLATVTSLVLALLVAALLPAAVAAQEDGAVDEVQVLSATYNPGDEPDDVQGYSYLNLTAIDAPDIPQALDLDPAGAAVIQILDAETGEVLGEGPNGPPGGPTLTFEIPAGTAYTVRDVNDPVGSEVYTGSAAIVVAYNPATGGSQPEESPAASAEPTDDATDDPGSSPAASAPAAGGDADAEDTSGGETGVGSGTSTSTSGATRLPSTGAGSPASDPSGPFLVTLAGFVALALAAGGLLVARRAR